MVILFYISFLTSSIDTFKDENKGDFSRLSLPMLLSLGMCTLCSVVFSVMRVLKWFSITTSPDKKGMITPEKL